MKKTIAFGLPGILGLVLGVYIFSPSEKLNEPITEKVIKDEEPKSPDIYNHWLQVRSYPDGFDQEEYLKSVEAVKQRSYASKRTIVLTNPWVLEGPGNIGGRFNSLASPAGSPSTIYAGACNGGIFKTTDGGSSWNPIFDDYSYLAIGDIEIDPADANKVYVGTGDKNFGGGSFLGNGVYRSDDAGGTWTHLGLDNVGIVTKVQIDPTDSDRIFVSTLGNTYEKTTDRGLYRSTDGGSTWTNVLFLSDSSGVIDFVINPVDPDIIYATGFNRINLPFKSKVTGPDAGIYKSTDGGDTWTELTSGLPSTDEARIGLAMMPSDPNTVLALYVDGVTLDVKDVYKTTDAGANWTGLDVHSGGLPTGAMGGFGWYFGDIHINPYDEDQLIIQGVDMYKSEDGGNTWDLCVPEWWTYEVHADKHDILYLSADTYIIATDGGLYKTTNNSLTWTDIEDIPVTQFYHIEVDPFNDGLYAGGAQDNGSMSGNAFGINSWDRLFGGDGFRMTYCTDNEGAVWYETQNSGLYYSNDLTGEFETVTPNDFCADRWNWDMPYLYNNETQELLVGGSGVWSMAGAPYGIYNSESIDLTKAGDGVYEGFLSQHTITELAQPMGNDDVLYVGTSDGWVYRGERSGSSWTYTNITGILPDRYVTGIRCSPDDEGTVYVTFSGYEQNDLESYLYKSIDYGDTWVDISGDLPSAPVNDIAIAPWYDDEMLFAALDGGVFFSSNSGTSWDYLGVDLPFATVSELHFDIPNFKLIAGTYSRSMFSYDISWLEDLQGPADLGVEENNDDFTVYPNPATDLIYFKNIANVESAEIYDLNGKLILTKSLLEIGNNQSINVSELPSGNYLLKLGVKSTSIVKL